jgi:hypothetical protein
VVILIAGLWPAAGTAAEFSVGVGLSEGGDPAAWQQELARLRQDIRALRKLEQQLDRLGRREAPAGLPGGESEEWSRQSEWLSGQAKEVAALAGEAEDYLHESGHGAVAAGLFDYQSMKFRIVQRLDAVEAAAEKYEVQGAQAVERQRNAVKSIARTF